MKIVSWNIRWGCGRDDRVRLEAIAAVLQAQNSPEVICLQEVAVGHDQLPGTRGEDQVALLARHFPDHSVHYAPGSDLPARAGGRALFGNLILCRLPVLQVIRHSLPFPADPGHDGMPRIALEAVIDSPLGPLRVITTHLEYYSRLQRSAQLAQLRQIHDQAQARAATPAPIPKRRDAPFRIPPTPRHAVYCGDFNCPPDAPELGLLNAPDGAGDTDLVDAWGARHPAAEHPPTVGLHGHDWPKTPYCCDYFYLSKFLVAHIDQLWVDSKTDASDHQPVVLTLV